MATDSRTATPSSDPSDAASDDHSFGHLEAADPGRPGEPMKPVDRAWLRMDEPANLMSIHGVLVFDRRLDVASMREVVRRRLVPIPRFRQRIVRGAGGWPQWQETPELFLERHVRAERLTGGGGEQGLREAVGRWMGEPFDLAHPPWSFHLIEDYEGGSALVGRLHHAIGDGIALMLVLLSLTDTSAQEDLAAPLEVDSNPFAALFTQAEQDFEAVRAATERVMPEGMKLLLRPAQALRSTGHLVKLLGSTNALVRLPLRKRDPRTRFKGPLGVAKRAVWSRPIPLEEIRALAERMDGNLNDVLAAALTGALRRYLLARGPVPDGLDVRAAVPVNLRPLAEMANLGNRFGLVFLPLPLGIAEPHERVSELRRRMRALKHSAEPLVTFLILRTMGRLPLAAQRAVVRLFATKTTAVLTSVPGPNRPLYVAGRRIRDLFFWVPQAGRVGLGLSICTYDGRVRVGVASDAGLVPDPEAIVAALDDELAAMAL
ncbi:MAG TPA: wax ester/triacylglycerol synthase family O-acyltransferase [Thermoanaerobaculia bacterium]|nr:wax ester/triacylglycerol synthase family O-acyltransferase [Thermoanaerobaculia bacterium]